ncbi:MAG: hypothetical protein KJ720_05805 [Proteobacteria bacterium]|nr:hypothetical protein [Pseudomonadota bacterium]MBU1451135.1 hypothetical protein [Pseudomonadota bacterium]MBU2467446.1 hypothetical protein [Pseudomonadota bacterium]MBU2516985.1 hypothetical protein [Pseudomonadota bacterium]
MARYWRRAALVALVLCAGCGGFYAPLGDDPARLELAVQGRVDHSQISQAVFEQVGPLMDQPTLGHWLGLPTWQVSAFMLGEAGAIWPLKPLGGLAQPQVGMEARGVAAFAAPAGKNRYRLTWACVVTHYWDEGLSTWQEPVYVYLRQRELTLEPAPGQVLQLSPFQAGEGK